MTGWLSMSRRKPASKRAPAPASRRAPTTRKKKSVATKQKPAAPAKKKSSPTKRSRVAKAAPVATKPARPAKSLMALGTGAYGGGLWAIIERVKRISGGDLRDACQVFELQLDALDDGALLGTVAEFDAAMRRAYD